MPRRSVQGDGTWTLQITPVFATVAVLGNYWYSADNDTDEEITVAEGDLGIAYSPTENLRIRGGLGYADRKRDQTIDDLRDTTEHDTGPMVRGDFRYVQPDFTVFGDARWTSAAPQDRLSGTLRGFYNLPHGRVTGRVFQRYGGGQGGSDSRVTGAGIGLTHELTQVSGLAFDASYAIQTDMEGDDPDIDRTDLTASYIHDLTESVSARSATASSIGSRIPRTRRATASSSSSARPSRPGSERRSAKGPDGPGGHAVARLSHA